ncbi:MAG: cation diffusion facilitator family transporter [Alphaproteobacteria bacterium]|nr:MAG: cation diffusion facilitator family transporter [Alphaproteobacteria bacterium]
MRLATIWAVITAMLLIAIKAVAWVMTGSVSILGSLMDSLMDAMASTINFFAVRHSLTPPDKEHRFGHGKAEALAGLAQFAIMTGSAVFLLFESIDRLINPRVLTQPTVGVIVIIVSIVITIALVAYQKHVVKITESLAVSADELHYRGDVLMNGAVLAALFASSTFGLVRVDAILGVGIAGYLGFVASQIALRAYHELMDREFEPDERDKILSIVMTDSEVISVHDLRTRQSGLKKFIQFHLELDPQMTLLHAHEIADRVEAKLLAQYPEADIIIHQDPAGLEMPTRLERT